jgi:hypothetical protein
VTTNVDDRAAVELILSRRKRDALTALDQIAAFFFGGSLSANAADRVMVVLCVKETTVN